MLKEKPALLTGIISISIAMIFCIIALIVYSLPESCANREVSRLNTKLNNNEMVDVKAELAQIEQMAVSDNKEAIEMLMQLSYLDGDTDSLKQLYQQLYHNDVFSSEYLDMENVMVSIDQQSDYESIIALLGEGKKREALELVTALKEKYQGADELTKLEKDLMISIAEVEWNNRDHEEALDMLFEAEDRIPADEDIRNELLKVAESAVTEYIAGQRYSDAYGLVEKCHSIFGRDVLADQRILIADMRAADLKIQKYIPKIKNAIEENDDAKLKEVLKDPELLVVAENIDDHIFENEIFENGSEDGNGIAVYKADKRIYIYDGYIREGKREGNAAWIFIGDGGELCRYDLCFVNDIPEGEGRFTGESTVTVFDEGGKTVERLSVTVSEDFVVHGGVYDGKSNVSASIVSGNDCAFGFEQVYDNGHIAIIKEDDYPEGLDKYFGHAMPVAGWTEAELYDDYWKENYKTTVWYNRDVSMRSIEGISIVPSVEVVKEGKLVFVSENRVDDHSDVKGFFATANPKKRPVAVVSNGVENAAPSYIPDVLNPIDRSVYPTAAGVLDSVGWDLKAAYYWSVNTLSYYGHGKPDMPENGSPGTRWFADFGFSNHKGNCFVFAATFCEMARLLGYPCRQMYGQVPAARGGLTPHSWTEVDINGRTYVFDPEFQHATGKNGFMIGYGTPGTWRYTAYSPMAD